MEWRGAIYSGKGRLEHGHARHHQPWRHLAAAELTHNGLGL